MNVHFFSEFDYLHPIDIFSIRDMMIRAPSWTLRPCPIKNEAPLITIFY